MSSRLGLVARREGRGAAYLGFPVGNRDYSEQTAREIDEEVGKIIQASYQRARKALEEQRQVLERIVDILCEKEVMDGEELRQLMKDHEPDRERLKTRAPTIENAEAGAQAGNSPMERGTGNG